LDRIPCRETGITIRETAEFLLALKKRAKFINPEAEIVCGIDLDEYAIYRTGNKALKDQNPRINYALIWLVRTNLFKPGQSLYILQGKIRNPIPKSGEQAILVLYKNDPDTIIC